MKDCYFTVGMEENRLILSKRFTIEKLKPKMRRTLIIKEEFMFLSLSHNIVMFTTKDVVPTCRAVKSSDMKISGSSVTVADNYSNC